MSRPGLGKHPVCHKHRVWHVGFLHQGSLAAGTHGLGTLGSWHPANALWPPHFASSHLFRFTGLLATSAHLLDSLLPPQPLPIPHIAARALVL